nr:immunoglobulin heavy chain junction region [Macaca mulatta]MOY21057.1 immunoglobulin heavy chain junction region [Macaca mulatta]MOY21112.1 immunoglobulin heavy chain junction region [Macaca mulatta]MOY21123.1 immunoglobulin heavy chain junction region [Macaca mulatta]MOY21224.1 immunoglobulin heavy chain junction region [Macaca mulatta]
CARWPHGAITGGYYFDFW